MQIDGEFQPGTSHHLRISELIFSGDARDLALADASEERLHEQGELSSKPPKPNPPCELTARTGSTSSPGATAEAPPRVRQLRKTVALYLVALAETHRPVTITRRLTSIAKTHAAAGNPNPATTSHILVAETLQGILRTLERHSPARHSS